MKNYFKKLNIKLTNEEKLQLLEFQETHSYEPFIYNDIHDGNYVSKKWHEDELPEFFKSRYSDLYTSVSGSGCVFLKNKGSVIRHTDVARYCSITIALNYTETCTDFWNDWNDTVPAAQLYHRGEAYLQNNHMIHSVDASNEARYFLQINYKNNTYEEVLDILNDYWK